MAIQVALHHKTSYRYDRPVTLLPHVIRLRPAPHCRTPILAYSLRVEPSEQFFNWQQDAYSNYLARLVFPEKARELTVTVDLVAEMTVINPFDFFVESSAEKYPFVYEATQARELAPFLETLPLGPLFQALVEEVRQAEVRTIDFVVHVNTILNQRIKYLIRMEPGIQTPEETLAKGSGSCRDSAWLMVQLLRHLGLAARFVSGYLIQLTADEKSLDGPSGPERDFTDLHAWTEVYLPGAGWVGLDATSGLLAGEGHIPLACAAEPTNAAAISGAFDWERDPNNPDERVDGEFQFAMSVTRLHETPRVTKPYTEEQWNAINALGRRIDEDLAAGDVRLTMGGEPTFVSLDDRDLPEWNTAAHGAGKRLQAGQLLRRLRDRFAMGGLLHFGQGKWYPGESLPRWALGCYWRRDGTPIWEDPALIADDAVSPGHGELEAWTFVATLAEQLGIDPERAIPAHEDVFYYLWRERRLPANVDVLKNKLDTEEERLRLAHVFQQGLDKIVGYALPLRRQHGVTGAQWVSGPWFLRREDVFLLPGDSAMGYRLPLDSLPWEAPDKIDKIEPPDPFAPRGPLPPRTRVLHQMNGAARTRPALRRTAGPGPGADMSGIVRTALCVEPRDGRLHVFMPPQHTLEDYLDLTAAVEVTAAMLKMPVRIEGYKPPSDHRLTHFQISPDPGVIEVNVQPASNWSELTENLTALYEEARLCRLTTEKFMLDGRHTGTGGGNHIVVGGPTAPDSPILRRPDLLRSLVSYWHNHPSLSYLFTGMFVGPTSQAPRIDEARNDALYELEIAFAQIPDRGGCGPSLVDRAFRNLLVDVSGNTHRVEFCMDKLFSPDSLDGQRGLLELRSYEMPPHARMSLVQHLLLRGLIARFWDQPYKTKLVRWNTELHDRFMLPHFVEDDFRDVLEDMTAAGCPLDPAWFAPHVEFRFPTLGAAVHRGVHVELRASIEPWHVLGEETSSSGTARYVDSSVERLQVKVNGLTDTRHVITCNGRRVPLVPTGVNGEYVAGVRYRAWQPPSCLHPTIPVHAPLVFDVLDVWNSRSIGGCTYHVSHPGGRAHELFPVNANEAEGRRIARFFPFGHTPGPLSALPPALERRPEFPLTLDLRTPPPATPALETPPSRNDSESARRIAIMKSSSTNGTLEHSPRAEHLLGR